MSIIKKVLEYFWGFWPWGLKFGGSGTTGSATPPATTNYLTDSSGNILTDDSGNQLTWQ